MYAAPICIECNREVLVTLAGVCNQCRGAYTAKDAKSNIIMSTGT